MKKKSIFIIVIFLFVIFFINTSESIAQNDNKKSQQKFGLSLDIASYKGALSFAFLEIYPSVSYNLHSTKKVQVKAKLGVGLIFLLFEPMGTSAQLFIERTYTKKRFEFISGLGLVSFYSGGTHLPLLIGSGVSLSKKSSLAVKTKFYLLSIHNNYFALLTPYIPTYSLELSYSYSF